MTAPVIPAALAAATVNRKWLYEVDTNYGISGTPAWLGIAGVMNSQFQPDTPNWVGDTDQQGQGFESSTKTGATWSGDLTVVRKVIAGTASYDPGQEYLRLKSIGQFGPSNTIRCRVYEYDPNDPTGAFTPRVEAYLGLAGVGWVPAGGDMLAEDTVAVNLTGQGKLSIITHPFPKVALAPLITSINPAGNIPATSVGKLVDIIGTGFATTIANGVKFGTTPATAYEVRSDTLIVASTPSIAAGASTINVTNAVGASNAFAVTFA